MMTRWIPALGFASLLLVACSTSKPAAEPVPDPVTEPTVIGAIDEAARDAVDNIEAATPTARRIGRVAGVIGAVFGGPRSESLDDTIDRYRRTRDVFATTTLVIAGTQGATEGAKRGFAFDQQFAELLKIEGIEAIRPYPDQIDVHIASAPSGDTLAAIAAVFAGRTERAIDIEAAGNAAFDVRESLIELGVAPSSLSAHRNDALQGIHLRVRYRD